MPQSNDAALEGTGVLQSNDEVYRRHRGCHSQMMQPIEGTGGATVIMMQPIEGKGGATVK